MAIRVAIPRRLGGAGKTADAGVAPACSRHRGWLLRAAIPFFRPMEAPMVPGYDTSPAADSVERLIDRLPDDIEDRARRLLRAAGRRSLGLCAAESCTGGLIATLLTDIEGQSHSFERGFVVYSDDAKAEMLGVPRALLAGEGAVSKAVALAMAEGALARSHADVALAVTGFAGRGRPGDEPGLVHFACLRRGREPHHREEHFGDCGRGRVRIGAVRVGLAMLEEAVRL
jgi:nicotinamide-nucleotide amidase